MSPENSSLPIDTLLVLLLIASATSVAVKWVKMPYAVALVLAGMVIGISHGMQPVIMTPEMVLLIFLPALLFEASWNLEVKALRRDWRAISVLATIGVVLCMFAVAGVLHYIGGFSLSLALLFGAMVSATDPVSVIALFRQMGIDKRLTLILEGESLFNDGTAVVLFKLVLAVILAGGHWSLTNVMTSFVMVVLGGALLGILIGFLASYITKAFDDHLLETTLTMITAYGSFILAEHLGVSPVIAVVAAGVVLGNFGGKRAMSASTRLAVTSFWEYAAFLVNSILFLLIGLQIDIPLMLKDIELIGFGILAVMVSRAIVIYGLCTFLSSKSRPIPTVWRHLLFWGGLRGALVMALALSLPLDFANRQQIINLTFGVVLFTLLVPGLTMSPLVKILGMKTKQADLTEFQENKSLLLAHKSELTELERLQKENRVTSSSYEAIKLDISKRIQQINEELTKTEVEHQMLEKFSTQQAQIHMLEFRKDFLSQLKNQGHLSDDAYTNLLVPIEQELSLLEIAGDNEGVDLS